ncbi:MAG: endo-1,4-beta-xylanase [Clostridia bacterium]|nr:endo-1,4-beta-xylanase [Clostridia bacterium]
MNDRRKVLELFDTRKDFVDAKVSEGIEKYRKGDAKLTVTDENGNPVSGAKITVSQKTHEFRFGANIFMLDELETDEKNEKYKKYFADLFNMATVPFYWDTLEPEKGKPRYAKDSPKVYRRPSPDLCIEFCEKHGIEPREHALAYERFFPEWLCKASVDEIKQELEHRYSEISERYGSKIPTIEVTNEMEWPNGKTVFYDEPDYIEWCFKLAQKYFPNNQLCINEWGMICWKDKCRATDKYYAYIEANLLKGARIDAIGMQYHLFHKRENEYADTRQYLDPKSLYRHMDLYSNFGKPLQVTEVTVPAYSWEPEDEAIQAEIIEKLYSIWFSHPNVEQIIYWNLVDGYAYVENPDPQKIARSQGDMTLGENYYYGGLLRFDMTPKPAYLKIKELLCEKWHTEEDIVTDDNGVASFRGFYGNYDVEIVVDGKKTVKNISLSKKENTPHTFSLTV